MTSLWSSPGMGALVMLCCCTTAVVAIVLGRHGSEDRDSPNEVQSSRFLYPDDLADPCETDHGLPGVCVDVRLCYAARRAVRAGNHPVRCGWIGHRVPKVCCHPDQVQRRKMVFLSSGDSSRFRRRNAAAV